MEHAALIEFVQAHFKDGLLLVVGSGLSAAEGMPGMRDLAAYLTEKSASLQGADAAAWKPIQARIDAGDGLEAALLKCPPTDPLQLWIAQATCGLLLPREREVMAAVIRGDLTLRLTLLLDKMLRPSTGVPILTTNYDRLVELGCEMSGFHVDTTAIGHYAGKFDHARSAMGSCKGIATRLKTTVLDHFPRAVVLKPHGSFDWYRSGADARRCSLDLDAERLIITPGIHKYRAGYESPFDKHRDLANDYIDRASRLFVVGYGFNDDHLETHLQRRILEGTPTLILSRTAGARVHALATNAPMCVSLAKPKTGAGYALLTKAHNAEQPGPDLWDLGVLVREAL